MFYILVLQNYINFFYNFILFINKNKYHFLKFRIGKLYLKSTHLQFTNKISKIINSHQFQIVVDIKKRKNNSNKNNVRIIKKHRYKYKYKYRVV